MKKRFSNYAAILVLIGMTFVSGASIAEAQTTVKGKYMVLLKKNGSPAGFESKVEALGGNIIYSHKIGYAIVEGLTGTAAAELANDKAVMEIQPDISFKLEPMWDNSTYMIQDVQPASADDPTTAYFYGYQWNMQAINASSAWAAGKLGSPDVTLAIIDSGIDYTYPDLLGRVDLSRSISFVPEDDDLVNTNFPGKHYVTDLYLHGTHVASTAVSNANIFAGITSQTTLIGVKVCGWEGDCSFGNIFTGLLYAADMGADVANMSLGAYFTKNAAGRFVGFTNSIFNYVNRLGMTVVVSAGNAGLDLDHDSNSYKLFCNTPSTICVSATGPTSAVANNIYDGPWYDVDALASYSNYGRSAINVAAPGGNDGGLIIGACSQTSLFFPICRTGTYILYGAGTSMAAPHVSGLAALLVEQVGRNPGRIKTLIQQSADDLGQPGTDPAYGKGRINVGNAVN